MSADINLYSAPAASRKSWSKKSVVARAEQIVDVLRDGFESEGWNLDRARAAKFLENVRQSRGDEPLSEEILSWMQDHGQSLDWLFAGDARCMIAGLAAFGTVSRISPKLSLVSSSVEAERRH
jgi:hypothetical protein